jgi:hypothetical protein
MIVGVMIYILKARHGELIVNKADINGNSLQQLHYQQQDAFSTQSSVSTNFKRLLENEGTFEDTIHLLKSIGDNCSKIVTKGTLDLQKAVKLPEHLENLNKHLQSVYGSKPDGHAGLFPGQQTLYVLLSHQPWVRQVCEIGFNAGHSALFWLVGSTKTKLVSYDIASWGYTKPMGQYLQSTFPGRLETFWGDSLTTVPNFWKQKAAAGDLFNCDVIVIDGSHNHDYVLADLRNMRVGANPKRHLIIMDDYPCRICTDVGSAFVDARSELLVGKYADCTAYPDKMRGMAFAYYNNVH